jgi:hypothetical protein
MKPATRTIRVGEASIGFGPLVRVRTTSQREPAATGLRLTLSNGLNQGKPKNKKQASKKKQQSCPQTGRRMFSTQLEGGVVVSQPLDV